MFWWTCFALFFILVLVFSRWLRKAKHGISLSGKHVCITGGSEGIGLSVAKECIKNGASRLSIISRSPSKLSLAASELHDCISQPTINNKRFPSSSTSTPKCVIMTFPCDVTSYSEVETTFGKIISLSPIDVLVTSAGKCVCDNIENMTESDFSDQLKLNVLGSLFPCQQLFRQVITSPFPSSSSVPSPLSLISIPPPSACIVLLSSNAGQVNIFGFSSYGASKFGIRGIWEGLTMEGAPLGIRVICAFPPNTDTPGLKEENKRKPKVTKAIEDSPGLYSAQEIAKKIVKAVEDGSSRVTFGVLGRLLGALTSGFGPVSDLLELSVDICLMGLGRIISAILLFYWSHVASQHSLSCRLPSEEQGKRKNKVS